MKWKTLHGTRYVNKQDDQVLWAEASLVSYKLSEKETNNSKIVAFFSKLHETRQALKNVINDIIWTHLFDRISEAVVQRCS